MIRFQLVVDAGSSLNCVVHLVLGAEQVPGYNPYVIAPEEYWVSLGIFACRIHFRTVLRADQKLSNSHLK